MTIAIMVPTLVVSIFSMNIALPYQSHPAIFWLVLALSAAASSAVLTLWRRLVRNAGR